MTEYDNHYFLSSFYHESQILMCFSSKHRFQLNAFFNLIYVNEFMLEVYQTFKMCL